MKKEYNKQEHLDLLTNLWNNPNAATLSQMINNFCDEVAAFESIPNVSRFRIKELGEYHPFLAQKANIKGKLKSQVLLRTQKPEFDFDLGENGKMNRYLRFMFKTLNKHRTDGRKFWSLGMLLLGRSTSLKLSCLKRIMPKWYKNEDWSKIKRMFKKYKKIDIKNYIYKQVFIPKPDGSLRPLGVPAPEWRLLLAGLNMLLLTFLSPYQHPNQHGYLPHRGTDSAWSQMDAEILNKSNIYDFDLMKFFDSVDLTNLRKELINKDIPSELVDTLIGWNRVPPQNAETSTTQSWQSETEKEISITQYESQNKETKEYYESLKLNKGFKSDYNFYHGVAQGSAISPTLSTLILIPELLLKAKGKVSAIMYADDGKLASNEIFNPLDYLTFSKECGIKVHSDGRKNGWDRLEGKWKQDSKFLGRIFEPLERHPENQGMLQTTGGIYCNKTKTSKPYKFGLSSLFNKAILYDLWIRSAIHEGNILNPTETFYEAITNPEYTWKDQEKYRKSSVIEFNLILKEGNIDDELIREFLSEGDIGISKATSSGYVRKEAKSKIWIHSAYKGYIGSRIYLGSDDFPMELKVAYNLDWESGSLCQQLAKSKGRNIDFNLYTASSIAYTYLGKYVSKLGRSTLMKGKVKDRQDKGK